MESHGESVPTLASFVPPKDAEEIAGLQAQLAGKPFEERFRLASSRFLGRPYLTSPLIGSPEEREKFVVSTSVFDCVTFCETVIALLFSQSVEEFCEVLRELRYEHGMIDWLDRNHYSIDWIRRNEKKGYVELLNFGEKHIALARELWSLEGYPPKDVVLPLLPLSELDECLSELQTGDILYFGTTREDLDMMHLGFLVKDDTLQLRHASRSIGQVVDEPLDDFLIRYGECPGILAVRINESRLPDPLPAA